MLKQKNCFPGAKSIVATGLRLPFIAKGKEDFFSANFSFSNAYISQQTLKGPFLFVDDNILKILCSNKFFRNIIRFASFINKDIDFDPYIEYEDAFTFPRALVKSKPIRVNILRKAFAFRQLEPNPLNYLQTIPFIESFLEEKIAPRCKEKIWLNVLENIKNGPSYKNAPGDHRIPTSSINHIFLPLDQSIKMIPNILNNRKPYRKKLDFIKIANTDLIKED